MAPPKYGDLGKQANDVFSKGYHFGLLKLEVNFFYLNVNPAKVTNAFGFH